LYTYVGYIKSQHVDDKSLLKGAWLGYVTRFEFLAFKSLEWLKLELSNFCTQVDYIES